MLPPGYEPAPIGSTLGAYFAHRAELEAASALAYRLLERDVVRAGAPRALVRALRRAARDEIGHAEAMGELARRHGASVPTPKEHRCPPRTLEELARANVVDGCVNETFAALVATWAGRHARDLSIRRSLSAIARDERGHAELAWTIARWTQSRLEPRVWLSIVHARDVAAADLMRAARRPGPPAACAARIYPDVFEASVMASVLLPELAPRALALDLDGAA